MSRIFLFAFMLAWQFAAAQTNNSIPTTTEWNAAQQKATELLARMTVKQKVREMHGNNLAPIAGGFAFTGHLLPQHVGGNKKLGIPQINFTDGPRGVITARATCFPVTMARGAGWDVELEQRVGEVMGIESRAAGGNYSGAVCINLLRHPGWGRAQETYGEDPYHVGIMGAALAKGLQSQNVMACAKHFALNSIENSRFVVNVKVSDRTLREVYLPHFKRCIDSGAVSIMSAYNRVNGEYCGHNRTLLTDILRNEMGFKGTVTSDWMFGLRDGVKGIKAGMNVEMPVAKYYGLTDVKRFMKQGTITAADIDALVLPTLTTKFLFQARKDEMVYSKNLIATKEHTELALEVAEKSAVLLKNESNILPLNKAGLKTIALVGSVAFTENTGDHGSSWVKTPYAVTPFEGLQNYLKGEPIELLTSKKQDAEELRKICTQADVVIVAAGLKYDEEGEFVEMKGRMRNGEDDKGGIGIGTMGMGGDRLSLELKQRDIDIINLAASLNKKVIVCLVGSGAFTMESWKDKVPGILMTFYSGMEGGTALAKLLFGDVNPSGKLPFTIPVKLEDLPRFEPYADTVEYGYYHGYTLLDKEKKQAAFPFGFGLSYTQFTTNHLHLTKGFYYPSEIIEFTVEVKNTGNRAGAEVVQAYVGFSDSKVDRPVKLLRAFSKVYLQPGETKTVTLAIPVSELAYYNEQNKTWEVERTSYNLLVGNSSGNLPHQVTFKVTGE